ncbi:MAG: zinc ribbon domain-containing protein [Nitrospira sp.]|nr:zinc ribbon domain-containing protein [Nitrospira sp.]
MPIYEYLCHQCHRRTSILTLTVGTPGSTRCRHCDSPNVDRLLSKFASPKSGHARLESLMDPSKLGHLDENDPASVARLMKKMGQEMGEDVSDIEEALAMERPEGEESTDHTDDL